MDQYHVQFDHEDGLWKAKRDGASRASVVGQTQAEVADQARELARKAGAELCVHQKDDNQIRTKESYGNDPRGSKG